MGNRKGLFLRSLDVMECCVQSIERENKPQNDFSYSPIEDGLNFLTKSCLETIIDFYFGKFIFDYAFLAHNINMNTLKNDIIKRKCKTLERYSLDSFKLEETILIFNQLVNKISDWRKFTPPSFKLSEHYFSLLKEE
jgi:hypothetical protein